MNRRTFLQTSTAAVASTVAVTGCLGTSDETNIPVEITTSDAFDDMTTHDKPEVATETTDDGDEYVTVTYPVTPTEDECADVSANVKVYDTDDIVLTEDEDRDQYDPGDTYKMKHTIPYPTNEISKITIGLSINTLSGKCYM